MGTSPKHYYGWQPRTTYTYDDSGRLVSSVTESVWDEYERALVDAYQDYRADLHTCGRPMSESLRVAGRPDPEYVVGTSICVGCMALDQKRAARQKADEKAHERGEHPEAWRLDTVYTRAEMATLERGVHTPDPDDD